MGKYKMLTSSQLNNGNNLNRIYIKSRWPKHICEPLSWHFNPLTFRPVSLPNRFIQLLYILWYSYICQNVG